MTIRISKGFILYIALFFILTTFGVLYMAQSNAIYEQQAMTADNYNSHKNETDVRYDTQRHQSTQNGEVLGIVK